MKTLLSLITAISLYTTVHAQDTILLRKYAGNLKVITVTIAGNNYSFLFDTGGGETFISPRIAAMMNKEVYGSGTGIRMNGDTIHYRRCDSITLQINQQQYIPDEVAVWDIMKVLPEDFPQLDGIISLKTFQKKMITLDLANNQLIIESLKSYRKKINNMQPVPSKLANGHNGNELDLLLGITRNNHLYWFLFDSGNLDKLLLSHPVAAEWQLQADSITQRNNLNTISIKLGSKSISAEAAAVNIIYDGALNFDFIKQSVFTINLTSGKVWMK